MLAKLEKEGHSVQINHESTVWDGQRGMIIHEDRYGLLWVQLNGGDTKPFLPEEVRYITRSGGRQ